MNRRHAWLLALLGAWVCPGLHAQSVEFNRDIRPILSEQCFACHGPDKARRKGDLRLDTEEGAFADLGGHFALVAGKPAQSALLARVVEKNPRRRMPPASTGKKLSAQQIDLLRRWIAQGARYQKHWAFLAPQRPALPAVKAGTWGHNAVDRFILARLETEGLTPSPEADRRTLIRRLSFDLIGLPPTPAEVDAFLNDRSADAYEKVVDRLLGSKHFGERMALSWLDLVRYGDTGGYHSDNHRDVWLYRDWVIAAFNRNLPFDRFTLEQLAGDLLPSATDEQRIASGYNRMLMTTEEGGAQPKEYAAKYMADRVRNAGSVWLGLTLGCAECHNHKFDPFTAREFYQFAAFWADIREAAVGRQAQTKIATPAQLARLGQLDAQLAAMRRERATHWPWQGRPSAADIAAVQRERTQLDQRTPQTLVSTAGPPRVMRVLPRGNWLDDSGEIVSPATPAVLSSFKADGKRATRADLARWLTADDHPLTARVFVNRLWKLYFGQGLVTSLEDFGAQGAWPSHPELLDWLAVEFRHGGWDVKRMVRLLVTSAAYRQSSRAGEVLRNRDPYNRLIARQGRFRLDAELVRDNALAVSGLLVRRLGGPSVKPYQPAGYWSFLNFPTRTYVEDRGENQYRRGLYTYVQRTFPHPSLIAFDASSREECVVERPRSNTPQQALVLLNDPTYVEAARALAAVVLRDGGATDATRLTFAYRRVLGRAPRPAEAEVLQRLLTRHREQYQADRAAAAALLGVGQAPADPTTDRATLAAWTSVARTLLNLHETITRE